MHYIPLNENGVKLLRLFTIQNFHERILSWLFTPSMRDTGLFECDAYINERYVFSYLDSNLARLTRFYESTKRQDNFIYYNCSSLYSDLWIQICHIDMLLEKQDEQVTNRLLEFRQPYIVRATHNLRAVDYKVLKKRKTLEQAISNFQNSQISQIDNYVRMCAYLPLSINKTQLNAATNGYLHYNQQPQTLWSQQLYEKLKLRQA